MKDNITPLILAALAHSLGHSCIAKNNARIIGIKVWQWLWGDDKIIAKIINQLASHHCWERMNIINWNIGIRPFWLGLWADEYENTIIIWQVVLTVARDVWLEILTILMAHCYTLGEDEIKTNNLNITDIMLWLSWDGCDPKYLKYIWHFNLAWARRRSWQKLKSEWRHEDGNWHEPIIRRKTFEKLDHLMMAQTANLSANTIDFGFGLAINLLVFLSFIFLSFASGRGGTSRSSSFGARLCLELTFFGPSASRGGSSRDSLRSSLVSVGLVISLRWKRVPPSTMVQCPGPSVEGGIPKQSSRCSLCRRAGKPLDVRREVTSGVSKLGGREHEPSQQPPTWLAEGWGQTGGGEVVGGVFGGGGAVGGESFSKSFFVKDLTMGGDEDEQNEIK